MIISRPDIQGDYLEPNNFLQYDIGNYLSMMPGGPITPIAPQTAIINAINNPRYRFIVAALSRRTGKTFIANVIAQLTLLIPGINVLIIAPNYALSMISWDLQRTYLRNFGIELVKANQKDKIIELQNGSCIILGSISQVNSVVGRSYKLILFDEAALNDDGEEAFNIQLRPTLDTPDSKAIFISTPRFRNYFYRFYQRGFAPKEFPRWVSILSTWKDNPRAILEDVEDARSSMSEAEFAQEYECSFAALEGRIYGFKHEHKMYWHEIDTGGVYEVIAGLDIGFRDHTALAIIVTDGNKFYVVDEYQEKEKSTAYHGEKIKAMMEKWGVDYAFIDSAAQQTKLDLAMDFDITLMNAKKSILDGIGYVATIVEKDKLMVDHSCEHTIESLESYRWDDNIRETPVKDQYTHMADAIRYALYSYKESFELV